MIKKRKNKHLLINALVLTMVFFAVFASSPTFAYWLTTGGSQDTASNLIEIGEWDRGMVITVNPNGSDDFSQFTFKTDPNEPLGIDKYLENLDFSPAPKTHSGVDHSSYTFDTWYTADGNVFDSNTVINSDLTVYPSWETTIFTYVKSSGKYNIGKPESVTYDPLSDLYIPGWRYKGLEINSVPGNSSSNPLPFTNLVVKNLSVGDGISIINYKSFLNLTADSLYLGEGLTEIKGYAFSPSSIGGSLRIPSTLVYVRDHAFTNVGFDGNLDLSDSHALKSLEWAAFMGNNFIGGLDFQESIEIIGQQAFNNAGLTGDIDLSDSKDLSTIGSNAFSNSGITGTVKIWSKLTTIVANSFISTNISTLDLSNADSLVEIGTTAFQRTPNLTTIIFPTNGSLKIIGTQSFQYANLTGYIILPPTLEKIGGVAFSGNSAMTQLFIPISVTDIGSGMISNGSNVQIRYEGPSIPSTWNVNWFKPPVSKPVIFNATP